MATKAVNFKMDESEIADIKQVAGVFNMSFTELLKNAVKEYLHKLKKDPYYRLTANIQNASDEESQEILSALDSMTDDDLSTASTEPERKKGERIEKDLDNFRKYEVVCSECSSRYVGNYDA